MRSLVLSYAKGGGRSRQFADVLRHGLVLRMSALNQNETIPCAVTSTVAGATNSDNQNVVSSFANPLPFIATKL